MAECKIDIAVLPHGKDLPLPHYATDGAAGMDIAARSRRRLILPPADAPPSRQDFALPFPGI